ncbi:MAG: hypothetical protein KKA73_24560 [Chloroflexi bacterium]|nr:hypothetical protein [Chloroflexota bacterium]MBU1750867.1 hypothetical protein [Chloroflexota bacterium]
MLEIRQVALAAGLAVQTERELDYDNDRVLRPDNLITLPNGRPALFEIEQAAQVSSLDRIQGSLRRKCAFFRSAASHSLSNTVRVLIDLAPSPQRDRTLTWWEQAAYAIGQEQGAAGLPFHLVAHPLRDFVEQPDWADPPRGEGWLALYEPPGPAAPARRRQAKSPATRQPEPPLPPGLRHSTRDQHLILQAVWQQLQERGPQLGGLAEVEPDPFFFQLLAGIYAPSYNAHASFLARAAYPRYPVYLLGRYRI